MFLFSKKHKITVCIKKTEKMIAKPNRKNNKNTKYGFFLEKNSIYSCFCKNIVNPGRYIKQPDSDFKLWYESVTLQKCMLLL